MSIFDRPANYDQRFYNEAPHRRVEPIAPSNPTQNQEPGHVSEYPQQDKRHVSDWPNRDELGHEWPELEKPVTNVPIQAAAAEAEMWRRTEELEREATQKGLQVDISV